MSNSLSPLEASPAEVEPVLFTIRDLSRILRLGQSRVRALIHAGRLRAVRVGDVGLRVRQGDLQQYLEQNPVTEKSPLRDGRRCGKRPGPRPRTDRRKRATRRRNSAK